MNYRSHISSLGIALLLSTTLNSIANLNIEAASAAEHAKIKRVLLISVDGLHGVDLTNYVASYPKSTLAHLSQKGVTYSKAFTARPSDSFPGLLSIVTGGTPRSTGVYYDDSYDRKLSPPGSNCSTVGTEVVYDESIDINPDLLSGGGNPGFNASSIDPAKLPLNPAKGCTPVYPHSFLRVNTIFEVIKAAGGYTAWSDKHPAYDIVNGPSGKGVDDLYTPEINNADAPTSDVKQTEAYDDIKVQAILNQIAGKTSTGAPAQVPTIFGMNFQAVSVGEKLPGNGYLDAAATPSAGLQDAINHTDASIGKMVAKLKKQGLYESTLIVITAKHGQSPIDPTKLNKPGSILNLIPGIAPFVAKATEDDVALLWLTDQSRTGEVVDALNDNKATAFIRKVYTGESLIKLFTDPATDSRTPDLAIQPIPGTIYTTSKKKIAEHGGFSVDDTNVALLVSNPTLERKQVSKIVHTTQIAPTILEALGLRPGALKAVRMEKTQKLPEIELRGGDDR